MTVSNYRDLTVWQKAMDLVADCYRLTSSFPASERFALCSQLQRAAVSVPANIAEGNGRSHTKEFLNHLSIANGSLKEVETHILIAERLRYIDKPTAERLLKQAAEVGRMLTGLKKALKLRSKKSTP